MNHDNSSAAPVDAVHTPGPWRIGSHASCVVADSAVEEVRGSDAVEYYGGHLICESVAHRNARLISAAPDLLAALSNFVELVELVDPGVYGDAIDQAREAINKAGG